MTYNYRNRTIALLSSAVLMFSGCINGPMEQTPEVGEGTNVSEKIINTPVNAKSDELLVQFSAQVASQLRAGEDVVSSEIKDLDVQSMTPVFHYNESNAKYIKKYGLDRWFHISFEGNDIAGAAQHLAQMSSVNTVQFNTISESGTGAQMHRAAAGNQESNDLPFNDTYLSSQWHYINTGSKIIATEAVEGADIGVKEVWEQITAGDSEIIVAILDGPVKYTHPDLKDNMWANPTELNGKPKVDDDNNGYIDDIHGWNFESDKYISWNGPEESSHGTHVAGIVGAVNNNGVGVCGVAGGSGNGDGVRLMGCQIMEGGISSNLYSASKAFIYAADNGAHIAQCSFGYRMTGFTSDFEYYSNYGLEYFAIRYFLDKERFAENEKRLQDMGVSRTNIIDGPLVIFASGNDGEPTSSYPGALMDCICVTATGADGLPAFYTNYGPGCNIAAPGGDIYLNTTGQGQILSTVLSENEEGFGDYAYMEGTSMACPHVSGVAALGLAYAKKLGKTFTREEFTALLLTSVNDIDSRLNSGYKLNASGSDGSRPYTEYQYNMGTGSIDAWKLMMNIEGTPILSVKVGNERAYSLDAYFGEGSEFMTYTSVEIDRETMKTLGITRKPTIKNGMLNINPGKSGSGKIKITAIAGGNSVAGSLTGDYTGNGDIVTIPNYTGMGGSLITREISIVSRGAASNNGGWL